MSRAPHGGVQASLGITSFPRPALTERESRDARVQTPRPRLCRGEPHVYPFEASSLSRAGIRGPAGLLTEPSGSRSGPELDTLSPSDPSHIAQGPVFWGNLKPY